MTPCNSGNSPTMPVDRSAFARRAARAANCRNSPPSFPRKRESMDASLEPLASVESGRLPILLPASQTLPRLRGREGWGRGSWIELLREKSGKLLNSPDLVVNAAELGVIDAVLQSFDAAFERHLAVLVPEETGVSEARAEHTLVAGDNGAAAVFGKVVRDKQKMRRWPAVLDRCRKNTFDGSALPSAGLRAAAR